MFKSAKKGHIKRGDTLVEVALAIAILGAVVIGAVTIMTSTLGTSEYTLQESMARNEIDVQAEALRYVHNAYTAQISRVDDDQEYGTVWNEIKSYAIPPSQVKELNSTEDCDAFYTNTNGGLYNSSTKGFVLNTYRLGTQYTYVDNGTRRVGVTGDALKEIVVNSQPIAGTEATAVFQRAGVYPRILHGNITDDGSSVQDAASDVMNTGLVTGDANSTKVNHVEGLWITATCSTTTADGSACDHDKSEYYDFYVRACWESSNDHPSSTVSSIVRLRNPDYAAARLAMGTEVNEEWGDLAKFSVEYYTPYDTTERKHKLITGVGAPSIRAVNGSTYTVARADWAGYDRELVGWCVMSDGNPNVSHADCANPVRYPDQITLTQNPPEGEDVTTIKLYAVIHEEVRLGGITISFGDNAGGARVDNMPASEQLDCETAAGCTKTYTLPRQLPSRSGYEFIGWEDRVTGTVYNAATVAAGRARVPVAANASDGAAGHYTNHAFWAQWRNTGKLQITFDLNAQTCTQNIVAGRYLGDNCVDDTVAVRGLTKDANDQYTMTCTMNDQNKCSINVPAVTMGRTGWRFLGWSRVKDGSVKENCRTVGSTERCDVDRSAGKRFTQELSINMTLYAKWGRDVNYKLAFNKNTTAAVSNMPEDLSCVAEDGQRCTVDIPDTIPTRTDYIFIGWALHRDAVSPAWRAGQTYTGGAAAELNAGIAQEENNTKVIAYAVWKSAKLQDMDMALCLSSRFDSGKLVPMKDARDNKWYLVKRVQNDTTMTDQTCQIAQNMAYNTGAEYQGTHTSALITGTNNTNTSAVSSQGNYYKFDNAQAACPSGWRLMTPTYATTYFSALTTWGYYNYNGPGSSKGVQGNGSFGVWWLADASVRTIGSISNNGWNNWTTAPTAPTYENCSIYNSWTTEYTECNNRNTAKQNKYNADVLWFNNKTASVRCMWDEKAANFVVNTGGGHDVDEQVEIIEDDNHFLTRTCNTSSSSNSCTVTAPKQLQWDGHIFMGWALKSDATEAEIISGCEAGNTCRITLGGNEDTVKQIYAVWREDYMDLMDTRLCRSKYFDTVGEDVGLITMRDRRDNRYYVIMRGDDNACWMVQNLAHNATTARQGTYVNPDGADGDPMGALESQGNYYDFTNSRSACPTGWSLPSYRDSYFSPVLAMWGYYSGNSLIKQDEDALYWEAETGHGFSAGGTIADGSWSYQNVKALVRCKFTP